MAKDRPALLRSEHVQVDQNAQIFDTRVVLTNLLSKFMGDSIKPVFCRVFGRLCQVWCGEYTRLSIFKAAPPVCIKHFDDLKRITLSLS